MIDALQQAQQALDAAAPLVQHLVGSARLGEADHAVRPVDLGVYRLGRDELGDVLLRLLGVEVEQLRQAREPDPRVVAGHHADVVLDDALAQVLPPRVRFRVLGGVFAAAGGGGEDVRGAEVAAVGRGDDGPAHEFGDGELFEEALLLGDKGVAAVGVDAVQEVGLLVVVGGEDDVVDDALEDGVELVGGFFDGLRVEDLSVVLADVEVFVVVFREGNLLFVVAQLEVRDVVFFLDRGIVGAALLFLLFPFFVLLFDFLGCLFWFPRKLPCTDLSAEDAGLCPIALFYA